MDGIKRELLEYTDDIQGSHKTGEIARWPGEPDIYGALFISRRQQQWTEIGKLVEEIERRLEDHIAKCRAGPHYDAAATGAGELVLRCSFAAEDTTPPPRHSSPE